MKRLLLLAVLLSGCTLDTTEVVTTACPSAATFDAVSPLLEERCGTLDCHGALSRPMRVYGSVGMRLITDPAVLTDPNAALGSGAYPNGMPTSAAERDATRRSLCALEPEVLEEVAAGQRDARHLMVLRKPMGGERHKGGVLIDADDPAVDCLKIWLEGGDPTAACQAVVP